MSIPIKLLQEAQGHIVDLELHTGETYRGRLIGSEDNMNVQLGDVTVTKVDGSRTTMEHVFVRGSQVRFFTLPDMLRNAPLFKKAENQSRAPPPVRGPKRR
ncbi:mRNA splicing protein SMD3 KNAG_0A02810 [Huiozyma naganishii CBS 8797]|uniref:Small nuclear ribonucleoprotein Sm D3 n=1 Tax=Huiozyma naganishii (strain ATCC MYA-139 / BCRC 22969 / CBS 8797 / KCTC 17520 / NBRC 10181 / NCYC 3082 / Yp74L-3) TaxID=1071383 RepID=J7QZR4_HUIN7|nr:hypothetical protein KNAG_0A02810 [Kazachstania naganishii CBS 8797]CCK67970.1 hypothetical protein KNAG_0A02810 [Kazachstania naganishii CBS 8797]